MAPEHLQLHRAVVPTVANPRTSMVLDPKLYYGSYIVEQPTCLTTLEHTGKAVKDHLTHYMGCIKMSQRKDFFLNEEIWGSFEDDIENKLLERKLTTAHAIAAQLKRIQVIRKAISKEKPKIVSGAITRPRHRAKVSKSLFTVSRLKLLDTDLDDDASTSLVEDVENSHAKWKNDRVYQEGIKEVRRWREERERIFGKPAAKLSNAYCPPAQTRRRQYRQLEYIVQFIDKNHNGLENDKGDEAETSAPGTPDAPGTSGAEEGDDGIEEYDLEKDINAYIVSFKTTPHAGLTPNDLSPTVSSHIKGKFPEQRLSLKYILGNDRILKAYRDLNEVRYLHIPSNNMHWIEEIIGQYYDRERPDLDSPHSMSTGSVASMLLQPQFWRGQQHVGGDKRIHARHLRPICERVSSRKDTAEDVPQNMVLFMPYLHWETDRKREAVARMIDETVEQNRTKQETAKKKESELRKSERDGLQSETGNNPNITTQMDRVAPLPNYFVQNVKQAGYHAPLSLEHATLGMLGKQTHPVFRVNKYGRVIVKNPLAQFLLDTARLYESMSNYRDQKMISKYLFRTAPLHPRRTLDQSHFWTLRSTRTRDRDQVVYRGTRIDPRTAHRLIPRPVLKPQQTATHEASKPSGFFSRRGSSVSTESAEDNVYYWSCLESRFENLEPSAEDEEKSKYAMRDVKSTIRNWMCPDRRPASLPAINLPQAPSTAGLDRQTNTSNDIFGGGSSGNGKTANQTSEAGQSGSFVSGVTSMADGSKPAKHVTCDQCREDISKVSRVVMVDQLWMWILDERTIITSFPRRYGVNKSDNSGVHKSIRNRLKAARNNQFRSAFDIALVILDECSNTFFDRTKTSADIPQVMDIFSEAIGNVSNKQTTSFERVWHWTDMASILYRSAPKYINVNDVQISFLDIKHEGKVQREIKDIIEELDIMMHINRKQQEIIKRFIKHAEDILDPLLVLEDKLLAPISEASEGKAASSSSPTRSTPGTPMTSYFDTFSSTGSRYSSQVKMLFGEIRKEDLRKKLTPETMAEIRQREVIQNRFVMSAAELNADIEDRIQELQMLKNSAESTAQSINDLLGLKQQQASVVQAWQGVQQAEEAVSQGRAIMVFTLITLVFLPLSFMSSVFGMNNNDFNESWTLSEQFGLMFPISFSLVIIVFVLAFSEIVRAAFWSFWTLIYNIVVIWTRLYYFWLSWSEDWSSKNMIRRVDVHVRQLRAEVHQQRSVHLRQQAVKDYESRSRDNEVRAEEEKRRSGEV